MFKNKKGGEIKISETLNPEKYTIANITQRGIIYDPDTQKYLIAKCIDPSTDFFKKYGPWEFVGGRVNKDENLLDAIKREIKEEAGDIKFEIIENLGCLLIETKGRKVVLIGYLINYLGGEIQLDEEHCEYEWKTSEEILENELYKEWMKDFIKKAEGFINARKNIDGWKRCQADFENYRKRQDERMKELGIIVKEDIAMQIFPVLDNFQASVDHVPEDQKKSPWVTGMMHIQRQLENVLKDNGIEEIEAKEGDIFNPEIHEAIENHQEEEKEEQHKIKKVVSKGYKIGNKVIRAAKVIVN